MSETRNGIQQALQDVSMEVYEARWKSPTNQALFKALVEEVGELAAALLSADPETAIDDGGDVYREACQVAAVAVRIMTEGECPVDYGRQEE